MNYVQQNKATVLFIWWVRWECRQEMKKLWRNVACWHGPWIGSAYFLCSGLTSQTHLPRYGVTHSRLDLLHQSKPSQVMATDKSDQFSSSGKVPSSQVTQSCVQLTIKTKQHNTSYYVGILNQRCKPGRVNSQRKQIEIMLRCMTGM